MTTGHAEFEAISEDTMLPAGYLEVSCSPKGLSECSGFTLLVVYRTAVNFLPFAIRAIAALEPLPGSCERASLHRKPRIPS